VFSIGVNQLPARTEIRLGGVIDHGAAEAFAQALEKLSSTVCLDLHDVQRITSYGVGLLIRHLSAISKNHKVEFARCSETMVDQFQMLRFSTYGRITSFQARFTCTRCQRSDLRLLEVAKLAVNKAEQAVNPPVFPCTCGGDLVVDDSLEFVLEHV
jgi:anti-anti-sigma factor